MLVSNDGGATFEEMTEDAKHSDNHSLNFRADDEDYLLVGTDGGIYESFDLAKTWRFVSNLPVTQYYKLAVDDAEPYYNIYGGTQDNGTHGGPSRTDHRNGIRNADWNLVLFADGHQPATEPGNPDIMYAEWQQGNLTRIDRTTGEIVYIKPQPEKGAPTERFNWDSPILVSPHDPKRLYFASQRLWRSDDRGDSWRALSGDLTRNENRMLFDYMDRQWSWDSPLDLLAMSAYNTITSISESPQQDGLIYVGTDDGLLQVTEDGGETWRRIEVGSLPGVPDNAFINDIKADLFDVDTVYVALDNHKYGDFKPYLLKSENRGRSWRSIASDLPDKHLVWRLVQDHVNPQLLFVGTEFGLFFSVDGGGQWLELNGGVPTIAFRDLAIQRRENDLVGASFGRGFYVLDDYTALRSVSAAALEQDAILFSPRPALWYSEGMKIGLKKLASQGAGYYAADNPPFGTVFTFYLKEAPQKRADARQEAEKQRSEDGEDTPFPGWDDVEAERREADPLVQLVIRDSDGDIVRRVPAEAAKGIQRVAWDLRYPHNLALPTVDDYFGPARGYLAAPGTYTATLESRVDGRTQSLTDAVEFEVVRMRENALPGSTPQDAVAFWRQVDRTERSVNGAVASLPGAFERIDYLEQALQLSTAGPDMDNLLTGIKNDLYDVQEALLGNQSKAEVGEIGPLSISDRLFHAGFGSAYSTYGPTPAQRRSLEIVEEEYATVRDALNAILKTRLPQFEQRLQELGAPWTPRSAVPASGR